MGTFHILEMVRKFDTEHLLMASTSSVYGNNLDLPSMKIKNVIIQFLFMLLQKNQMR